VRLSIACFRLPFLSLLLTAAALSFLPESAFAWGAALPAMQDTTLVAGTNDVRISWNPGDTQQGCRQDVPSCGYQGSGELPITVIRYTLSASRYDVGPVPISAGSVVDRNVPSGHYTYGTCVVPVLNGPMCSVWRAIDVPSAAIAPTAPSSPAQAPSVPASKPEFVLGFKSLHDLDPADIGDPIDNQASGANGDALQHTTKGLMAWRKADNWTAFTNGYMTWINGPSGLASRLNTERFSWEA